MAVAANVAPLFGGQSMFQHRNALEDAGNEVQHLTRVHCVAVKGNTGSKTLPPALILPGKVDLRRRHRLSLEALLMETWLASWLTVSSVSRKNERGCNSIRAGMGTACPRPVQTAKRSGFDPA